MTRSKTKLHPRSKAWPGNPYAERHLPIQCSLCKRFFLTIASFVDHFSNLPGRAEDEDRKFCHHNFFVACPRSKRRLEILRHVLPEIGFRNLKPLMVVSEDSKKVKKIAGRAKCTSLMAKSTEVKARHNHIKAKSTSTIATLKQDVNISSRQMTTRTKSNIIERVNYQAKHTGHSSTRGYVGTDNKLDTWVTTSLRRLPSSISVTNSKQKSKK